jgi:hypothetical protein
MKGSGLEYERVQDVAKTSKVPIGGFIPPKARDGEAFGVPGKVKGGGVLVRVTMV